MAVVFLTLNYFNLISLSSFLPKSSSISKKSVTLEQKAQAAGYQITWKGHPNDTTERTMLTSKDRAQNIGFPDEFGYLSHKTAVIGIFVSFTTES